MIGQSIGHYRVAALAGRGGMGVVYLAEDSKLGRRVAIKVLSEIGKDDAEARRRFLREARATAALDHPFICHVHEAGEFENDLYLVLEYLDGETLKDRLSRGPLPPKHALQLAIEIAEALEHAHRQRIIHRDLKPSNVMVTPDGHAKVLDFGLALRLPEWASPLASTVGPDSLASKPGTLTGTLAYMSPEQLRGESLDARSDVFSLGMVIYEMLAGVHPLARARPVDTIAAILNESAKPLRSLVPDMPEFMDHVIEKALAKDRDLRHQSAQDLRADLIAVSARLHSGSGTSPLVPHVSPQRLRLRKFAALTIAALIGAVGIVALMPWMRSLTTAPRGAMSQQQVTFTGDAESPALSPDGELLAYVTAVRGQPALVVRDLDGTREVDVLRMDGLSNVRWSPDGSEIAVLRQVGGQKPSIFIVPRLGGTARPLPAAGFFAWGPDGRRLVVTASDVPGFRIVDKTTGNLLSAGPQAGLVRLEGIKGSREIDWSSVTDRVLLVTQQDAQFVVWSVRPDGSDARRIHEHDGVIQSARWSPVSNRIYLLQLAKGGNFDLVELRPDQAEAPRVLLSGLEAGYGLSVARDRLIYRIASGFANLRRRSLSPDGTVNTADQEPVLLTRGTQLFVGPEISPDLTRVAYVERRGVQTRAIGSSNIHVLTLATGETRQLTFFNATSDHPVWAPDGQTIAFASNHEGRHRVWLVPADGGTPSVVQNSQVSRNLILTWAPGREILYQQSDVRNLRVLDPKSGAERALLKEPVRGFALFARYNHDGARVAVSRNLMYGEFGVAVVALATGVEHVILREPQTPIGWSPDGRWIYTLDRQNSVWRLRADGSARELMLKLEGPTIGATVSADGRVLVYSLAEGRSDLWLVTLPES